MLVTIQYALVHGVQMPGAMGMMPKRESKFEQSEQVITRNE
jgi:hypothetical protein